MSRSISVAVICDRLLDVKQLLIVMLEESLVSSLPNNKLGYVIICCFIFFYSMLKPSEFRSVFT